MEIGQDSPDAICLARVYKKCYTAFVLMRMEGEGFDISGKKGKRHEGMGGSRCQPVFGRTDDLDSTFIRRYFAVKNENESPRTWLARATWSGGLLYSQFCLSKSYTFRSAATNTNLPFKNGIRAVIFLDESVALQSTQQPAVPPSGSFSFEKPPRFFPAS